MSEKQHTDIRLHLLLTLVVLIIGLAGGYDLAKHHFREHTKLVTDTVTVFVRDTLVVEKPTEVVRYIVRHDTVRDLVVITDSAGQPQVAVPIEQAVYSDSTEKASYTAYVSGYRAALDSIQIDCRNTETVITNIIEKQPRRIGFGVQLGIGVSPKGVAVPYLGLGVQYKLW